MKWWVTVHLIRLITVFQKERKGERESVMEGGERIRGKRKIQ